MTYDQYQAAITAINEELEGIADATRDQAWAQVADVSNPRFRDLMARHAKLTQMAAELNTGMLELMGSSCLVPRFSD